MADTNLSILAELIAIVLSSVAFILLEPHAYAFDLGYEPGAPLVVGTIFAQLLFELIVEAVVDSVAMWAEAEHRIDVPAYFSWTRSAYVGVFYVASATFCLLVSFLGLLRHSFALTCS